MIIHLEPDILECEVRWTLRSITANKASGGDGIPAELLLLSRFSCVWLCATPETAAHQAPPSLGFSREEHWSGLPFPSPMHESEKWDEQKMMLLKCCTQYASKIWKTQQWPQDWKTPVFIPIPKKGNAKECSNYCTTAFIEHSSKVMLRILQSRLQQYMNQELLDVQAGFRKGRRTRDQIANNYWIIEKAREFQKNLLLLHWLC